LTRLIEAFRRTHLLVQIVWFYYAFLVLPHIQLSACVAAAMVLSLYTGSYRLRRGNG
jgi:ABC-type amino acid transport system permease subunit